MSEAKPRVERIYRTNVRVSRGGEEMTAGKSGRIVLLNGVPRSGKSSIAAAMQAVAEVPTVNLGVDATMAMSPRALWPGIGLRPGGERPDLEDFVERSYRALLGSMAAYADAGIDVVADVGIHDSYSRPLGLWALVERQLHGRSVYVVGVRCSIEEILRRRALAPGRYEASIDGRVPDAVLRWEAAVHDPGHYDLAVDTTRRSSAECAEIVLDHLRTTAPAVLLSDGRGETSAR